MKRLSNRRVDFKEVKKPILIVCEDSKSSVIYFRKKIKDLHVNPVDVEVDGDSDSSPISVVNYAIERKKAQLRQSKKSGTEEYEQIYCVMDVDDHPSIKDAIMKARANSLIPIVSNQCFELWYLLHFMQYSTAHIHRDNIEREFSKLLGTKYNKADENIYEILKSKGNEQNAIALAKKLIVSAESESTQIDPHRNPSTTVFVLIEKLNSL